MADGGAGAGGCWTLFFEKQRPPALVPTPRALTRLSPADLLFVEEPDMSEHDPSQKDGFRIVYDKECPFEMRLQETDEAPQVGALLNR